MKAVELSHQEGVEVQQVAAGLDIHPFMLSRWRKEYREGRIRPNGTKTCGCDEREEPATGQEIKRAGKAEDAERLLKKWQRYLADQHQKGLDLFKATHES
jgi:transposase